MAKTPAIPKSRDLRPSRRDYRYTDQGIWVEFAGDVEDWAMAAHVIAQDGQLVIAELRVLPERKPPDRYPRPRAGEWDPEYDPVPPGGFQSKMLAGLRPYRLLQDIEETRWDGSSIISASDYAANPTGLDPSRSLTYKRRPGRRGHGRVFYAVAAELYVLNLQGGDRHPTKTLAKQIGTRGTSYENAKKILKKARDLGLLTKPPPGRAGGQLTPEALDLLEQEAKEDSDGKH